MSEDIIIIEHLQFESFRPSGANGGEFLVRRLDDEYLEQSDVEKINEIINELDLWEDFISVSKIIYNELISSDLNELTVEDSYRENKYHLETDYTPSRELQLIRFFIKYTTSEASRITRGARNITPFNIDDLKTKIKNVKKWRKLFQFINVIGS